MNLQPMRPELAIGVDGQREAKDNLLSLLLPDGTVLQQTSPKAFMSQSKTIR